MFNNMSLSKKMLGSFGLVLILLTLVIGIYQHITGSTTHNFVKLLNTEVAIARHATTSEVYMLHSRRNEKDFLIRKDNKYVRKLAKNVAGLKSEAQAIIGLAEKGGDRDSVAKASAIIGYATEYETTFKKLVVAWETRGLNHKSGLQGKFRDIAHEMEAAIGELLVPNAIALYLDIRKNEKDYLLRNDEKYVKKTRAAVTKLLAELKNAGGRQHDINDAAASLSTYQHTFNLLVEENGKIAALTQKMRTAIHKVGPAVEDLRQRSKKASIAKFEATKAKAESLSKVAITGGIVAIGIGLFLAFVITRGLVGPISKSVNLAKIMAAGDFTQTLAIEQKNEIGVLAGALNNMASGLGGMFKDISSGVETLSSSSTELSAVSRQMSTNAEQAASQAETVAAGAEELSVNANSVAAAMEQAATNVGLVTSAADQMAATIDEIAQNTEKARAITAGAVSKAEDASSQVGELGQAANAIGKVVETITEISEQVNLLALNATIEAARAGEAGKGFAVVANEIKELARQTAEATGEIKTRIEGIQSSTDGTVKGIGGISGVVGEINEIVATIATAVEEQSVTTREIAENVTQAATGIGEVNENVAQSSAAASEIAQEISKVSQGSAEINSGCNQVNDSAGELSKLAEELNAMVGRFKV